MGRTREKIPRATMARSVTAHAGRERLSIFPASVYTIVARRSAGLAPTEILEAVIYDNDPEVQAKWVNL